MKVLVTGATGFIGRHLTQVLCEKGYSVRVLVRPSSNINFLKSLNTEIVYGEITDYGAVTKAVEGCQYIYHLAAKTSRTKALKQNLYAVNVDGTENVARAASLANVKRLIFGSSCGVYGIIKNPPANEKTATFPNTPYRQSKLLGEKIVLSYYRKTGLPVVIVRLPSVIGYGSLNWLGLCKAIATEKFRLIGKGENYMQFCHALDAVDGLMKCALAPNIAGNCYIIADEQAVQLNHFVNMVAQELGVTLTQNNLPKLPFQVFFSLSQIIKDFSDVELPRSHQYEMFLTNRILTIAKAQKELDYCPSIPFRQGVHETIQWYKEQGRL